MAQAAVAVGDTVSFASVLNSKYYDSLHKTILTGTGSTMTITNDTAAVANINVIDLTAFGLSTLTAAQCQAAFPRFLQAHNPHTTCIEATGKNLFDKTKKAIQTEYRDWLMIVAWCDAGTVSSDISSGSRYTYQLAHILVLTKTKLYCLIYT